MSCCVVPINATTRVRYDRSRGSAKLQRRTRKFNQTVRVFTTTTGDQDAGSSVRGGGAWEKIFRYMVRLTDFGGAVTNYDDQSPPVTRCVGTRVRFTAAVLCAVYATCVYAEHDR